MRIDLSDKTALVTGGAGGLGQACADILTGAGARVVVADIDLEGAERVAKNLSRALAIRCDLGDPHDILAMRDRALAELGGIDILINCGGLLSYQPGIAAVDADRWDQMMRVNVRGTFLVSQALFEQMKERGGGKIVNFSSMAARLGGVSVGMHYTSSKSAIIGLTRALAKEGGPFGIKVNAVAPGIILTPPVREGIAGSEEKLINAIPLGRFGEPQDVANTVLFLASPLSDYITGIVLDINGGFYLP